MDQRLKIEDDGVSLPTALLASLRYSLRNEDYRLQSANTRLA